MLTLQSLVFVDRNADHALKSCEIRYQTKGWRGRRYCVGTSAAEILVMCPILAHRKQKARQKFPTRSRRPIYLSSALVRYCRLRSPGYGSLLDYDTTGAYNPTSYPWKLWKLSGDGSRIILARSMNYRYCRLGS